MTHADVDTGLLPEFAFASARETFIKNHQMPGFEKADWKSDKYSMEFRKCDYISVLHGISRVCIYILYICNESYILWIYINVYVTYYIYIYNINRCRYI